ncbi:MAG: DUF393 domain-containing protein [Nitrospirae bacterium]|nr:DUF393 domain-containing protein [Nitrospirota bacterium]
MHPRLASPPDPPPPPRPCLVLYDGACGWCTGWVRWLARRDRAGCFAFAPLEGTTASLYLDGPAPPDTLVVVERAGAGVRLSCHSEAVFRALRRLGGPWRALAALAVVPRPLTDWGYRLVATRRHRLPGRPCPLPPDRDAFWP